MMLEHEIKELQNQLAQADLIDESRSNSGGKYLEFLLLKLNDIKIKMYQERSHAMPHIHIDYSKQHHVASFSIEPPIRLEGTLDPKYDRIIIEWVTAHKDKLLELWNTLQAGNEVACLVAELSGDTRHNV